MKLLLFVLSWMQLWINVDSQEDRMVFRIPVPPVSIEPWWIIDPKNPTSLGGFVPAFYKELEEFANIDVERVYITDLNYLRNWTDFTKQLIDDGIVDGSTDFSQPLDPNYSYTMAIMIVSQRAIVYQKSVRSSWTQVFAPFETELWLTLLGTVILGALIKSWTKRIIESSESLSGFATNVHYTALAFLGGGGDEGDYEIYPGLRIYQLGLFFLVLIVTSSYTANLASFLTRPSTMTVGPTTMNELKDAKVCTVWSDESDLAVVQRFVKEIHAPVNFTSFEESRLWVYDELIYNQNCDAFVGWNIEIQLNLLQHCNVYTRPEEIDFAPFPFYIIMSKEKEELFNRINNGILRLMGDPKYKVVVDQTLHMGKSCDAEEEDESFVRMGVNEMAIPLILFLSNAVISLIITWMQQHRMKVKQNSSDVEMAE